MQLSGTHSVLSDVPHVWQARHPPDLGKGLLFLSSRTIYHGVPSLSYYEALSPNFFKSRIPGPEIFILKQVWSPSKKSPEETIFFL